MKKKLAALLAGIMVLSPLTVFGATDNKLTGSITNVVGKTLFLEERATTPVGPFGGAKKGMLNLKAASNHTDEIEYAVDGTTINIDLLNESVRKGDTFRVVLSNAEWFFRNTNTQPIYSCNFLTDFVQEHIKEIKITSLTRTGGIITDLGYEFVWDNTVLPRVSAEFLNEVAGMVKATLTATQVGVIISEIVLYDGFLVAADKLVVGDTVAVDPDLSAPLPSAPGEPIRGSLLLPGINQYNHKEAKADFSDPKLLAAVTGYAISEGTANVSTFLRNNAGTFNATESGAYFPDSKTYVRFSTIGNVNYVMTVSNADKSTATVYMAQDATIIPTPNVPEITVPLPVLTNKEGDVRVDIAAGSNTTSISSNNLQFGQAAKNNTATTVKTEVVSKYNFLMDQLIIAEKVPNSLQAGGIILQAPYGYTFVDPEKAYKDDGKDKWVTAYGEESLFFKNNVTKAENTKTLGSFIRYAYDQNDKQVKDKIVIDAKMLGLLNTGKTNGKLVIEGLQLTASDYASMDDDIKITIRDVDTDSNSEDDNITGSDRIAFAPDFVVETNGTTSKMEINKPIVNGGNIEFSIERISNGKAAELKFSNVYVKIDRTVPESNKKPYNIVAGGNAIAANYYENQGEKRIDSYKPFFGTKGIGVEYLNVVTSANDKDSILSNVVRLEIGSDIVKIGRNGEKEIKMDTAPYISPQTNSTMIPVRYVAIALGIAEDQISWDSIARKVTITNGSRIVQFEIGNSEIIINGVSKTMYSPDVPPIKVVPEIKDDRAFLPFRELGNAFGVGNVHWDEASQSAIYNYNLVENPTDDAK